MTLPTACLRIGPSTPGSGSGPRPPATEKLNASPCILPPNTHIDSDGFTRLPSNLQRHSTQPISSSKADYHAFLRDRRAQTGFGLPKSHSSRINKSRISSLWRRPKEYVHGDTRNYQPFHSTSRQSTMGTKYSETFEQTIPWDQKAILSLGESAFIKAIDSLSPRPR